MLFEATSSVPQGSNLGPLLFLTSINDIGNVTDVKYPAFRGDLKLYFGVPGGWREIAETHPRCSVLHPIIYA